MKKITTTLVMVAMLVFVLLPVTKVSADTLQITTTSLPDATVGLAYSAQIQGSGGVGPYTWSTVSTTYPSGCCVLGLSGNSVALSAPAVTFNTQSSSIVTGSPGTYSWVLQIKDSTGATANQTVSLKINPAAAAILIVSDSAVSFNYTKGGTVPASYLAHISNNSNSQTINYNISIPNQPAWLDSSYNTAALPLGPLQSAGIGISVDPTSLSAGTYNTTINLTGNFSNSPATIAVTLIVTSNGSPLQITTTNLPSATIGQPYSYQLQATGGTAPYTWSSVSTTYPSGCCVLGVNTNGLFNTQAGSMVINTYPAGTYSWDIQVKDAVGNTATQTLSLVINSAATTTYSLQIPPETLPTGLVGTPYYASIPYTYNGIYALNATWTGLPPGIIGQGLASDPDHVYGLLGNLVTVLLQGTPTAAGVYTAHLSMTDQYGTTADKDFNITVSTSAPTPTPTPTTGGAINLPDGTVIKLPNSQTVYLVSGGQLTPFTSAQDFLSKGYTWSQVQQVSPSQVVTTPVSSGTGSGLSTSNFYPYPSGSIVNDNGTIYFINGSNKAPFTNYAAFQGLGYSLKNVVQGDLTNYTLSSYSINTANAAHPWGSWLIYKGTVYYSSQAGLIGVPSSQVFTSNGGNWDLLVKANSYDIAAMSANPNLPPLTANDSRVVSSPAQ